jgi:hypothetical protein
VGKVGKVLGKVSKVVGKVGKEMGNVGKLLGSFCKELRIRLCFKVRSVGFWVAGERGKQSG